MGVKENGRKKLISRYTQVIYVSRTIEFEGHAFAAAHSSATYGGFLWTMGETSLASRKMM